MEGQIQTLVETLQAPREQLTEAQGTPLAKAASLPALSETISVLSRARRADVSRLIYTQLCSIPRDEDCDAEMRAAAALASLLLKDKKAPTPPDLRTCAQRMHDLLPSIRAPATKTAIVRVCETFWSDGREGREALVENSMRVLLQKVIGSEAGSGTSSTSDVKRLYSLRGALLDASQWSQEVRALLVRSATTTPLLRITEGQRFLASLLASGIDGVHDALLHTLPTGRKSRATACGAVYVNAWKLMESSSFEPLLADILTKATLAAKDPYATNLRTVLSAFHSNKRVSGMDEFLDAVYKPILFRSLTVANPLVRRNSAMILVDAFPIHDPAMPIVELEAVLQRQCDLMVMLLEDPAPIVRVVAAEGASRVLGLLWEIVPPPTSRKVVDILSAKLAFDKSSASVRVAACDGLRFMLDNHLTHGLVAMAVKRLGNLVDDSVERVRVAFLELLVALKAKRIVAARYFDVVPVERMLARLPIDTAAVCGRVMKLLVSSYFPLERKGKSAEEVAGSQIRACMRMLQQNAPAALVFYEKISMFVGPGPLVEFCIRIATLATGSTATDGDDTLIGAVTPLRDVSNRKETRRRRTGSSQSSGALAKDNAPHNQTGREHRDEDQDTTTMKSTFPTTEAELRDALLELVDLILASVAPSLAKPSNEALLACVVDIFGGASLKTLIRPRGNGVRTRAACLRIAATLPPKSVQALQKVWADIGHELLDILQHNADVDRRLVVGFLRCGLLWRKETLLGAMVHDWTDLARYGSRSVVRGSKRRSTGVKREPDVVPEAQACARRIAATRLLAHLSTELVREKDLHSCMHPSGAESAGDTAPPKALDDPAEQSLANALLTSAMTLTDACLERGHEADDELQCAVLQFLASSLTLTLVTSSKSATRLHSPEATFVHNILGWASESNVVRASFELGDTFGLGFANVISSFASDAAALNAFRGADMSVFASAILLRAPLEPALGTPAHEALRSFGMHLVSGSFHFLAAAEIETLQDPAYGNEASKMPLPEQPVAQAVELFRLACEALSRCELDLLCATRRPDDALVARFREVVEQFWTLCVGAPARQACLDAIATCIRPVLEAGSPASPCCATLPLATMTIIGLSESRDDVTSAAGRDVYSGMWGALAATAPVAAVRFASYLADVHDAAELRVPHRTAALLATARGLFDSVDLSMQGWNDADAQLNEARTSMTSLEERCRAAADARAT